MSLEEKQKVAPSIGVDGFIKLFRGGHNARVEDIESFEGPRYLSFFRCPVNDRLEPVHRRTVALRDIFDDRRSVYKLPGCSDDQLLNVFTPWPRRRSRSDIAASTSNVPELPPQITADVIRCIVFVTELDVVRRMVEIALRFRPHRTSNGPLRSAGDEDTKGEIVIEEAALDAGEQFLLISFSGALVEAIDEDGVRETAGIPNPSRAELLERANYEVIHLNSDGLRKDEAVFLDSLPDTVLESRVVLS
jgi:hypothetical protein